VRGLPEKDVRIAGERDLSRALRALPRPDEISRTGALERQSELTKPAGSLGRLEELVIWLAGWQRTAAPRIEHAHCLVFAGNHGVAERGVSAYPSEVTAEMIGNFNAGGAAINQLCQLADAELRVIPLELDRPTRDIAVADAMTKDECAQALQAGIDAVPEDTDLLLLGEMGIGNTTSAAALALAAFGGEASDWVGSGTGVERSGLERKLQAVRAATERTAARDASAFERLRRLGGRELAAIAGAVVAARRRSIPVLLDGFVASAAAAPLEAECSGALDHVVLSHLSAERGHRRLAAHLSKAPVLDLGMRLGEASGAAVCLLVLRAAVATHNGMATFASAAVSNRVE